MAGKPRLTAEQRRANLRASWRAYYHRNRAAKMAYQNDYRARNKEHVRRKQNEWRQANKQVLKLMRCMDIDRKTARQILQQQQP